MSVYEVHVICRTALKDEQFRTALAEDPAAALEPFALDAEERDALLDGDVARLYGLGAHEYVLMWLGRAQVFGLTVPEFMQRITQADPHFVY